MFKKMIAGFIPALAFSAAVSPAAAQQPVKVLIVKDNLPMSYHDEKGAWVGFDVDMARALCATMKVRCEFKETVLSTIVDQISAGEGDIGIGSLHITPERMKKVSFTDPYRRGRNFFISKKLLAQSKGMRVAVVSGSTAEAWAKKKLDEMQWTLVPVKLNVDLGDSLTEGRADAAIVPFMSAVDILERKKLTQADYGSIPIDDLSFPVGLAVNPKRSELRDQLNAALTDIKANGQLDEINSKYFKFRIF